jgi:small subunit ribosomal protein S30e
MAKTHGNLAKAGKVKGQTPEVEPKDRILRKKTGRACKRKLYNRRFKSGLIYKKKNKVREEL